MAKPEYTSILSLLELSCSVGCVDNHGNHRTLLSLRPFPDQETFRIVQVFGQVQKFLRGNLANDLSGFPAEHLDHRLMQIMIDLDF